MADALRKSASPYDRDFDAWTQDQAAELRAPAGFDSRGDIDWENAAEGIESTGNSERDEIERRLGILIAPLLTRRDRSLHDRTDSRPQIPPGRAVSFTCVRTRGIGRVMTDEAKGSS